MKRTQLRSKDISKEVEHFNLEITKKDQVELIEDQYLCSFMKLTESEPNISLSKAKKLM